MLDTMVKGLKSPAVEFLRIGQLARAVGVQTSAIRYYERRKLVSPASRSTRGYRLYDEADLERLRFIKRAQDLGFTLNEITAILRVRDHGAVPCGRVRDLAAEKIQRIDEKVRELARLRNSLADLVESAQRRTSNPAHVCPLIEQKRRRQMGPLDLRHQSPKVMHRKSCEPTLP